MQVSVEITSGLGRRLTIGVPAARIDSEIAARLEKAAKSIRLKGFRQGKVPMKVVRLRSLPTDSPRPLSEVPSVSTTASRFSISATSCTLAGNPPASAKTTHGFVKHKHHPRHITHFFQDADQQDQDGDLGYKNQDAAQASQDAFG